MKRLFYIMSVLLLTISFISACGGSDAIDETQDDSDKPKVEGAGGYLFLHMKPGSDYGNLFYSISRDGINWETLNNGNVILANFSGHSTVTKGHDGNYYMIGCKRSDRRPLLWKSDNLVRWSSSELPFDTFDVTPLKFINDTYWWGAPKMYYDDKTAQYIITWHAHNGLNADGTTNWETMRTFYILSSDLKTFTKPQRLFNFTRDSDKECATIDVFIRRDGDKYYAILKDERWPDAYNYTPTGKAIRISSSDNLTGPYTDPGPKITPSWREAPSLVRSLDGKEWYIYAEDYTQNTYRLYKSDKLVGGKWVEQSLRFSGIKHGWVQQISEAEYLNIYSTFKNN